MPTATKIFQQLKNKSQNYCQKVYKKISQLNNEQRYWIILILIVILGASVRFYQLAELPMGYNFDEAGMGYDAWCLANWRVSRNMMHFPVYLLNAGGGQSVLYAYLTAGLISIFGMSKFILRTTAVIFGLITIIFGSLITKEALGKKAGLLAGLIIAISPYFIMMSRLGFDCNLFLGASTLALYLTIMAIKKQKYRFWIFAGFAWSVTLYSYILSYIAIPIFIILLVIYLLTIKKINWRQIFVFGISILVLAWPLILLIIVNYFDLLPMYSRFFYIPKLTIWRGSELASPQISSWFNLIKNLPHQLFTLTNGDVEGFIPNHGSFYWFAPSLIIIGFFLTFWQGLKNWGQKRFSITTIIILWTIGQLVLAFSIDSVIHYRLNAIYFALVYFLVFFLFWLAKYIKKWWHKQGLTIYWTAIIMLYFCFFSWFCHDYFVLTPQNGFPIAHFGDTFEQPLAALDNWLKNQGYTLTNQQIYLDEKYIFYYLTALIPPQETGLVNDQMREVNYQNFHFEWLPDNNSPSYFAPAEIKNSDIFIIQNKNDKYIQKLTSKDFIPIYQNARYTVYLNEVGFQTEEKLID
ncbi:MAG: glycosyltransferase family 39 protein [bacterium]|nr:glycosyltransferase family 39 protein [bacterium]